MRAKYYNTRFRDWICGYLVGVLTTATIGLLVLAGR